MGMRDVFSRVKKVQFSGVPVQAEGQDAPPHKGFVPHVSILRAYGLRGPANGFIATGRMYFPYILFRFLPSSSNRPAAMVSIPPKM